MYTRNLAIANRPCTSCAHKVTTVLKWPSKVTQGHWKCYGSTECAWLSIIVPSNYGPILYHFPHIGRTSQDYNNTPPVFSAPVWWPWQNFANVFSAGKTRM